MFLLQLVSGVVDSISNNMLRSILAYPDQRLPFPPLHGLLTFNGCLVSLPFITVSHHCLAMCADKGGVIVWLSVPHES